MTSQDYRQVLKKHKKPLNNEINYDDIEHLLTERNLVEKDEYDTIGELITNMSVPRNPYWSLSKCLEVLMVIKSLPKYEWCVDSVISKLLIIERSYSIPIQAVDSEAFENGELLNFMETNPIEAVRIAEHILDKAATEGKCFFNIYTPDGKCKLEKVAIILQKYLPQILESSIQYVKVICASFIEILKKYGKDKTKHKIGVATDELLQVFKRLQQQEAPINVKAYMKEEILPRMKCIGAIVKEIVSDTSRSLAKWASDTVRFNLIDKDKLKMICYHESVLDYLIKMLDFLKELDKNSPNQASTIQGALNQYVDFKESLRKAKVAHIEQAKTRGWHSVGTYTTVTTIGTALFCIPAYICGTIGMAVAVAATAGVCAVTFATTTAYRYYCLENVPSILDSCEKENKKEQGLTLDKIPAEGLKKFC